MLVLLNGFVQGASGIFLGAVWMCCSLWQFMHVLDAYCEAYKYTRFNAHVHQVAGLGVLSLQTTPTLFHTRNAKLHNGQRCLACKGGTGQGPAQGWNQQC